MLKRIRAIVIKEFRHIVRDPRTLSIVFAMPVMMVLLYGYALNMDVKHIKVGVLDYDRTPESRAFISAVGATDYFDITEYLQKRGDIDFMLRNRRIKAAVIIPEDFSKGLGKKPSKDIQIIVDGSDPTFGNATVNYLTAIAYAESFGSGGNGSRLPLEIRERFLYNPDLIGAHFIIPGVVAVILMMVCALLTSITIAREKETGTMDILLVSPVRPMEIIVGKVIPYIVLSILDAVFILVFATIIFKLPFRGDPLLLFGMSILYVYSALSMGLLISSVASSQQVAMMAALIGTVLPAVILSGFIFSIFSMPLPIRVLTRIVPARYYITIIRGIILKGSSFGVLSHQAGMLALIGTVFLIIAAVRFNVKKS